MDLTSAHPFWPLQDGLPAVYPSLKQDLNCEILVLGGGITGAFIAHHLVKEGLDVVVMDKRDNGRGSTAASTALLEYEIDVPLTELAKMIGQREAEDAYRICRDSIGNIETIVRELNDSCGFRRKKVSIWPAGNATPNCWGKNARPGRRPGSQSSIWISAK
jgi:choline dehydrogenase-like flavoprotein